MSYQINFSQQSQNDIEYYKKTGNKVVLKKLLTLLTEISEHPYTGTENPKH